MRAVGHPRSADGSPWGECNSNPCGVRKRRGMPRDTRHITEPQRVIANTASKPPPCNLHLDEAVKARSLVTWDAGGVDDRLPGISFRMTQGKQTAILRSALVDTSIPALLVAAASVDLTAIVVDGRLVPTERNLGNALGCTIAVWPRSEDALANAFGRVELTPTNSLMIRAKGRSCAMRSTSTATLPVEALGMTIASLAGTPARDARPRSTSNVIGRSIVDIVVQGRKPSETEPKDWFLCAIIEDGRSTNFEMHRFAIAGRLGIDLIPQDLQASGARVLLMANTKPRVGLLVVDPLPADRALALRTQVKHLFHTRVIAMMGTRLVDSIAAYSVFSATGITSGESPSRNVTSIAVLSDDLVSSGAFIVSSAVAPECLRLTVAVIAFERIEGLPARIDDPFVSISAPSVIVLPSGPARETVIPSVALEAAAGAQFANARTSCVTALEVENRYLSVMARGEEYESRSQSSSREAICAAPFRGLKKPYEKYSVQASEGANPAFLFDSLGDTVGLGYR